MLAESLAKSKRIHIDTGILDAILKRMDTTLLLKVLTADHRTVCIFAPHLTQDEMEQIARDYAIESEGDYEDFERGILTGIVHPCGERDGHKVQYRIEAFPLKV